MKVFIRVFVGGIVLLAWLEVGAGESGPVVKKPCPEFLIQLQVNRAAPNKALLVKLELTNAGQKVLYIFDDTLLADAFQVRGDVLWYDISTDFYIKMADVVLSTEHIRAQPKHKRLGPGDTLKYQLQWVPRNAREREAQVQELAARITVTEDLPDDAGTAFARVFGSGPLSCTREARIPVEKVGSDLHLIPVR